MRRKIATRMKNRVAALTLLFAMCSLNGVLSNGDGSGTRTGNPGTILGVVVDSIGKPVKGASVFLRRDDYLVKVGGGLGKTGFVRFDASTNDSGRFVLDSIDTGSYTVEVNDGYGCAAALKCAILENVKRYDKGTIAIAPVGLLQGHVPRELNNGNPLYVQIYGLERIASVNQVTGEFSFPGLPAGEFTLHCSSTSAGFAPVDIGSVKIVPDSASVFSAYASWAYNAKIMLNTTAAGVQRNVHDFPALVRLTNSNFVFSRAHSDGGDLRFAKADGTPLPYEIERWDPVAGQAEIWVRIDTINGNDSTQSITMYWGNPNASGASSGAKVFDTANGFAGVWHFAEADNNLPGGFKDATANAFNLTGATRTTGGHADGIIGGARKFGTIASDSIVGPCPGKLGGNSSFTVSFWIKIDTLLPTRPCILDFGKAGYLAGGHFFIWPDDTAQFGIFDTGASGVFMKPSDPEPPHQNVFSIKNSAATWMYIVSVYDAGARTLTSYVNGTVMDRDTISAIRIDIAGGLHIGRPYSSYYPGYFGGIVDEVRILSTPGSEERIRLSYVNESPDNTFIKFK